MSFAFHGLIKNLTPYSRRQEEKKDEEVKGEVGR